MAWTTGALGMYAAVHGMTVNELCGKTLLDRTHLYRVFSGQRQSRQALQKVAAVLGKRESTVARHIAQLQRGQCPWKLKGGVAR